MHQILERVLNPEVSGKSLEDFITGMLAETEKAEYDKEKLQTQNRILRQWNSHHREVNATYRIDCRDKEIRLDAQKLAMKQAEENCKSNLI